MDLCQIGFSLPNTVREHLLQSGRGETALLLDAIIGLDFDFGNMTTVTELTRVLWTSGILISPGLIRRALHDELFSRFVVLDRERGRPEVMYRIPSYDLLVNVLAAGVVLACDRLGVEDMGNLRDYRAGLHREFLKRRKKGQFSREFMGKRLGVGKRVTSFYEKDIERWLVVRPQYDVLTLTGMSRDELSVVFAGVQLGRDVIVVHTPPTGPRHKCGFMNDYQDVVEQKFPALFGLAWKMIQAGLIVELKRRKSNEYEWVG